MDAIGLYQFLFIQHQRMQIDELQTILLSHFLLDGDDTIDDDGIIDVPRVLEGRDRRAEEDLRLTQRLDLWCRWYPT